MIDRKDTLGYQVAEFKANHTDLIPWIIRFLENPDSKFSLPGRIYLYNHDCLHVVLNKDATSSGEAFIIGFCMGNDPDTQRIHLLVFLFFAQYIYPKNYRFNRHDFIDFRAGFNYGKVVEKKRLNSLDFSCFNDCHIISLQNYFGIYSYELDLINQKIRYGKINLGLSNLLSTKPHAKFLKNSSSLFAVIGGFILAMKFSISSYGFIFLACSSFQLFLSSCIEKDKSLIIYSASLFICVDSLGIYRWLLK